MTRKYQLGLLLVLIGAAIFYFWHLGRPDIITDEASHAVRAIGMVDFDFGIEQPTPWQWVERVPGWMRLSFHDHPIMLFLAEHVSIRAFGETPFAVRLPSALAGIASVWLLYLIGRRLYSPAVGFGASALFAVTVNHVWISRIGLFESLAVAFMLAAFWAFLRGLRQKSFFALAALFLGLAVLTKYTALILLPIFLTILLIRRRDLLVTKTTLVAAFLFLLVASPIVIYNIQLYRAFGHFDFQFSQLFGQDVKEWQARPGQEVLGSYAERVRTFVPRLIESNSPYFLSAGAAGLGLVAFELIRRRRASGAAAPDHLPLAAAIAWLIPFLVFIGPAHRFLALLTPWLAIAAGYAIATIIYSNILKNIGINTTAVFVAAAAAIPALEAAYAYNSVVALQPVGPRPWTHAAIHRQTGSWGFNELEDNLASALAGKMPDPAISFQFQFARDILADARARGIEQRLRPVPLGIVYNDNINLAAQLWIFLRRITYHGWPVMSAENFRNGGREFLLASGVREILFVNATTAALQDRPRPPTQDGDLLEDKLTSAGAKPVEIKNPKGEVAFRIYLAPL